MSKLRIIIGVLALITALSASAQSKGDQLFLEGQKLQQTMTISSQNQAIKKFEAAKVVYTSTDKKTMCDNQISQCKKNISSLRKKATTTTTKKEEPVEEEPKEEPVVVETHKDVQLSLSATHLDFKYKPKEGEMQSVDVTCNYDDWEIVSHPDWVTVYTATAKFSVEVTRNKEDDARSGIVTVKCGDKEVDLIINQKKASKLEKARDGLLDK